MTPYRYLIDSLFVRKVLRGRRSVLPMLYREQLRRGESSRYSYAGNYTHFWTLGEDGTPIRVPTRYGGMDVPLYRFDTATLERGLLWLFMHVYSDVRDTPLKEVDLGAGLTVLVSTHPEYVGYYVVGVRPFYHTEVSNVFLWPSVCLPDVVPPEHL